MTLVEAAMLSRALDKISEEINDRDKLQLAIAGAYDTLSTVIISGGDVEIRPRAEEKKQA